MAVGVQARRPVCLAGGRCLLWCAVELVQALQGAGEVVPAAVWPLRPRAVSASMMKTAFVVAGVIRSGCDAVSSTGGR